jgi:hypothetical protein
MDASSVFAGLFDCLFGRFSGGDFVDDAQSAPGRLQTWLSCAESFLRRRCFVSGRARSARLAWVSAGLVEVAAILAGSMHNCTNQR